MNDLDALWDQFNDGFEFNDISLSNSNEDINTNSSSNIIPKCSNIYISTKTKIAYLNQPIDLYNVFWNIPINKYYEPIEGFIKKEIKFNSSSQEELNLIQDKLKDIDDNYFEEYVITNVVNPTGRITFKDIRKISIGYLKKILLHIEVRKKVCFIIVLY